MKIIRNSYQTLAVSFQRGIGRRSIRTVYKVTVMALLFLFAGILTAHFSTALAQSRSRTAAERTTHVNSVVDRIRLKNGGSAVIFGVSNFQKYDGSWDRINPNIYVREEPADGGYSKGVWTGTAIVEFPDTLSGWVTTKLRDGIVMKQKFEGLAFLNKQTKDWTVFAPAAEAEIVISANTITYKGVYKGVDLRYTYYDRRLKTELVIPEQVRNSLNAPYPDDITLMAMVTQIDHSTLDAKFIESVRGLPPQNTVFNSEMNIDSAGIGLYNNAVERFRMPAGWAFADSMQDPIAFPNRFEDGSRFRMKRAYVRNNGKNFLLSGISLNVIKNTDEHPGSFIFDPSIEWQHEGGFGKDTWLDKPSPDKNYGDDDFLKHRTNATSGFYRYLIQFDSLQTLSSQAAIDSAFLILQLNFVTGNADSIFIYPVTREWTEGTGTNPGTASWDSASTGVAWTTAGGDYATDVSAKYFADKTAGQIDTIDVTSLVRRIVKDDSTNYGWLSRYKSENTTTKQYHYYSSDYAVASNRPKLVVYISNSAFVPFDLSLVSLSYDQLIVTAKDTSGLLTDRAVFYDEINNVIGDTIYLTDAGDSLLTDTLSYAGFYDSLTQIVIATVDTLDVVYTADETLQVYTMAQYVPAVSVIDTSAAAIKIIFTAESDSNPDRVFYRIEEKEQGLYISSSGDTSYSDTSWYQKTDFDTVQFFVNANTLYRIFVNSRNSDSLVTGTFHYDSLWSWAQIPDMISAFPHSKDSVLIKIDPESNPAYTFFAVEDSISGRFIDVTSHTLRSSGVTADSSWAWAKYSEWGASNGYYLIVEPNTTYVFRAYAKEGKIREP